MFVCCEYCLLLGRGLCEGVITRPEESHRLWCVVVCDIENSTMRRTWPTAGAVAPIKETQRCNTHCRHLERLINHYNQIFFRFF